MNPFLQGLRPDIHGSVDPAFAQVREVFEANFFERGPCTLLCCTIQHRLKLFWG